MELGILEHFRRHVPILIETALALLVLTSLGYVALYFRAAGHLPHPFQSDPTLSLMDFYNTAYWAHRPGAYEIWHTVYPPLSFAVIRLWTVHDCFLSTPEFARACDPAALIPIGGFYLLNIVLVYFSYRKCVPHSAIVRTIALCAGLPMLYSLELANLIVVCFTFFVLAEGGMISAVPLRWFNLALAFNFKPYLAAVTIPLLVRRKWHSLIGIGIASVAIYAVTYALEGAGSPLDLLRTFAIYAGGMAKVYATQNHLETFPAGAFELWDIIYVVPLRLGQVAAWGCGALVLFTRSDVSLRRLFALALTFLSSEAALGTRGYSADYTLIFSLFLIFMEEWKGALSIAMVVSGYLLCTSADYTLFPAFQAPAFSYLGNRMVMTEYGPSIGQFVRPAFLLVMQYSLIALVVRDVRSATRQRAADVAHS